MNKLKYKLQCWLSWKHPVFYMKIYNLSVWWYEARWKLYFKRHRECCEFNTMKHCAEKLAVNPKKATCWGYVPETCPECHRKIPKRILLKWMDVAIFVEHYEDAKEDYAKFIKQQNKKKGSRK